MSSRNKNRATPAPPVRTKTIPFILSLCIALLAAILIFTGLGHYSLWDDEAGTALAAKGVLRTGDTSALVDGHNLLAYRNGAELSNLALRYAPPLQSYLAAPFLAALGEDNAFAARIPFALCAMACILLLLWWLLQSGASVPMLALTGMGLAINVSFLLFGRQCRYYAPVTLCSLVIAYCHLHDDESLGRLILQVAVSVLLLTLNYLNYIALAACLAADWFCFLRRKSPLKWQRAAFLIGPQVIAAIIVGLVWNPLSKHVVSDNSGNWLIHKSTLLFWNLRDMNRAEMCSLPLLLVAAFLCRGGRKNRLLLRGLVCVGLYVSIIALTSPQPINLIPPDADIRYLVPLIPLCVTLAAATILLIAGRRVWIAFALGIVAFGTNLLNGGPMLWCGARSTITSYVGELAKPPPDPYTAASKWINKNVAGGESIWVLPDYMTYPLMFHAPNPVYAWQLAASNHDPQFRGLPDIHFQGRIPPDYIVAFGPVSLQVRKLIAGWPNVRYEPAATIDCYWRDLYRPELLWRTFKPVTGYNKEVEAIYVLKRRKS